ncbi:hypothetical protein NQZ68_017093, partial [Dissostichus eleginoides]
NYPASVWERHGSPSQPSECEHGERRRQLAFLDIPGIEVILLIFIRPNGVPMWACIKDSCKQLFLLQDSVAQSKAVCLDFKSGNWKPTQHSVCSVREETHGGDLQGCRFPPMHADFTRRGEVERKRGDYELNVDLSSAGCGSKEKHWQAEHRIHQSLISMPSSSFSEAAREMGRVPRIGHGNTPISLGKEETIIFLCREAVLREEPSTL